MHRALAILCCLLATQLSSALVARSQAALTASQLDLEKRQAFYAAESGLKACLAELAADADWKAGFAAVTLPGARGDYTIRFASTAPESSESVNNLIGTAPVPGRPGSPAVLPGCALIVCRGRYGNSQVWLKADISGGAAHLHGQVRFADAHEVQAPLAETRFSRTRVGESETVPATRAPVCEARFPSWPSFDVSEEVAARRSGPEGPKVSLLGSLALTPGPHYYGQDVIVPGDLTLAPGACLYVRGRLQVHGRLSGSGRVLVDGDVEFSGGALTPGLVSVLSSGHISVRARSSREERARFHGLLYAEGSIYADKQVSLTGAVIVQSNPQRSRVQRGDVTLYPGDVRLEKGSRSVYFRALPDRVGNAP